MIRSAVSFLFLFFALQFSYAQITGINLDTLQTFPVQAKIANVDSIKAEKIFTAVEVVPVPQGGYARFCKAILDAVDWDPAWIAAALTQEVELQFHVNSDLRAGEITVVSNDHPAQLIEPIISVVRLYPWSLGISSGRPLKTRFSLKIRVDFSAFSKEI